MIRRATGFFCALLLAALPWAGGAQSNADQTLIRVGAAPDDTSLPIIYAYDSGLFKKAGLNVEYQKLGGSAIVSAAIAGGSLEIAKAGVLTVITAHAKGLPFTVVGGMAWYNTQSPDTAIVVLNNSPIKSPSDLIGKVYGTVSLSDMNSIATYAWLGQHGVDAQSLKYIEVPPASTLAALQQERIAGSTLYEPYLSQGIATGSLRVLGHPYDAIGKHFPSGVMFANTAWADSHRELLTRFLRVLQAASVYVAAHESQLIPLMASYSGLDAATLANQHHSGRGVVISAADLQAPIDASATFKAIPNRFPASDLLCTCALTK